MQVSFTNRCCVKVLKAAVDSVVCKSNLSLRPFSLKMKVGVLVKLFPFRKVMKVTCEERF